MGFLRGRDSTTVAGQVIVDGAEFVLGDEVTGRVSLRDLPPHTHATLELGQERWFYPEEEWQGSHHKEFFSFATDLLEADASGSVEEPFVLAIPPNAPPSSPLAAAIEWRVVADLEAPGARVESPPFTVLAPRDAFLDVLDRTAELSRHDWPVSPGVDLDVGDGCVRCGDTLSGRLLVTPEEDTRARQLAVRLDVFVDGWADSDRTEQALVGRYSEESLAAGAEALAAGASVAPEVSAAVAAHTGTGYLSCIGSVELGRDLDLAAGRQHEFPFSLEIPAYAPPTIWEDPQRRGRRAKDFDELYPTTFWNLKGGVKKGRFSGWKHTTVAIHVYNAA
ncbi:MAG: hypothetical protein M3433_03910 [Actinomycetota bacterium]|nr:hypothetical protein [Actinomycetota bacterium]